MYFSIRRRAIGTRAGAGGGSETQKSARIRRNERAALSKDSARGRERGKNRKRERERVEKERERGENNRFNVPVALKSHRLKFGNAVRAYRTDIGEVKSGTAL